MLLLIQANSAFLLAHDFPQESLVCYTFAPADAGKGPHSPSLPKTNLRHHRTKGKKQKPQHHRCRKSHIPSIIRSDGRTESDRRPWGSAGQNQVRQSEHHIPFGCLFDKPSVSRSSVTQLPFHDSKYMLDFCSDGGFLVLSALGLCFWSGGILLVLGWSAIDVVPDFLTIFVFEDCKMKLQ